jgi:hypothetical protein
MLVTNTCIGLGDFLKTSQIDSMLANLFSVYLASLSVCLLNYRNRIYEIKTNVKMYHSNEI